MRPQEVWDRPQDYDGGPGGPRKGSSQSAIGKSGSLPSESTSGERSGSGAFSVDGSSPADATEENQRNHNPQLYTSTRPRALSVQLEEPKAEFRGLDKASAAAALQRAIQSSPVRCRAAQNSEAAGKDLTPKPTRRVLFPSPTQSEQRQALQSSGGNTLNVGTPKAKTYAHMGLANKENLPPHQEEEHHHIINRQTLQRSVTPTPSSERRELTFKTPNRNMTPERIPPTTGDFFSSAAKALLRPQTTPNRLRSEASQVLANLSPFTVQMSEMLSEANAVSPPGSNYGFSTLPSLHNTPGRLLRQDLDFSTFDRQDLLSTDVPMASSPPLGGWFGVYEDPIEGEGDFWTEYPLPQSSPAAVAKTTQTPRKLSEEAPRRAIIEFPLLMED